MKLYTIGYAKYQTLPRLLAVIPPEVIIIDVRRNPNCGWNPEFCAKFLQSNIGTRYRHCPELGNQSKTSTYVAHEKAAACIRTLLQEMLPGHEFCLLCWEQDHRNCHRDVIAERMRVRSWGCLEIVHL